MPDEPSGPTGLRRPPSDRYRPPEAAAPADASAGASPARGLAFGLVGGAIGAALVVLFGGVLSFSVGLVVVAFFVGRVVGLTVRAGALDTLSSPARVSVAILVALGALAVGQVGVWAWAQSEGGSLGLADFLGQTFGALVPLEFMVATLAAWWSGR